MCRKKKEEKKIKLSLKKKKSAKWVKTKNTQTNRASTKKKKKKITSSRMRTTHTVSFLSLLRRLMHLLKFVITRSSIIYSYIFNSYNYFSLSKNRCVVLSV